MFLELHVNFTHSIEMKFGGSLHLKFPGLVDVVLYVVLFAILGPSLRVLGRI